MTKFLIELNDKYIYLGDEDETTKKYKELKNKISVFDKIYLIPLHRQLKLKKKEKALILHVERNPAPIEIF